MTPLRVPTLGRANSPAQEGQIILSEIHYNPGPPSPIALGMDAGITADDLEFLELYNASSAALNLAPWQIRGGISFDIDADVVLEPQQTLLVLSFDPRLAANADRLAAFRTQYAVGEDIAMIGGYEGQLGDDGQLLRLLRPDQPTLDPPDGVYIVEEEVLYDDLAPWPVQSDGGGDSLHRVSVKSPGGMASSWAGGPATPGDSHLTVPQPGDANLDGVFDRRDLDLVFAADRFLAGQLANWTSGDWNGDGYFNPHDIVLALQSTPFEHDLP